MAVSVISAPNEANAEIGEIKLYPGSTAPPRWLLCNGDLISRTTYSDLFDVIGTTYGGGDGSTTYAIPDFKGRMPIGVGESAANGHTAHTLGQSDGEETHTLVSGELASHQHWHVNNNNQARLAGGSDRNTGNGYAGYWGMGGDWNAFWSFGNTTGSTGSNTAHNTMSPYLTVNFIIYTGVE